MTDPLDPTDRLRASLPDRYSLERELGAGGMATVWLAADLKHHRRVALKVLRAELAATLGSERFLREITIIANLQHPHILPLHDSGDADGFLYYVMPFIEGPTLRTRLRKERELPVTDTVRILRDVADALAHAHAQGVVHRDLKPENIMLSGRHALVADFGVAKAVSEARGTQTLTTKGVALGTPTYMAPEQATADPLTDHRADIYALGVMAYEMLTGDPPFVRHTPQALLAAHLAEAPVEVTQRRDTVPTALGILIMRCLAKKPADRPQRVEEVLEVLETLATPSLGMTPAQTEPLKAISPWTRRLVAGGAVAAIVAIAALAYVALRPDPLALTVSDVQPITSDAGIEWLAAISPDGGMVAYVAGSHVAIRSTVSGGEGGGIQLEGQGLRSSSRPAWRADGEYLRFFGCPEQGACAWMEIGRMGGAVRSVSLPPGVPATNPDLAWSADDAQVAFFRSDTLFVASSDGGVRPVFFLEPSLRRISSRHSIAWSPDGKRVAFVNGATATGEGGDMDPSSLWVVEVGSGRGWELLGGPSFNLSPVWMDERRLLFVSDRDGSRAVYVAEVGRPGSVAEPRALPQISDPRTVSYSAATGRVAFSRLTTERIIRSYLANSDAPASLGDGVPVITGNRLVYVLDLSPDGKWIAYDDDFRGQSDIYKAPLVGGPAIRLTDTPRNELGPEWSLDGSEISFEAPGAGGATHQYELWTMPADGGTPTQITTSPPDGGSHMYAAWLPDGRHLTFGHVPPGGGFTPDEIWVMEREAPGRPWGEPRRIAESGHAYGALDDSSVLVTHPSGPQGPMQQISVNGTVLWSRDVPATSALRVWGRGVPAAVSPDRQTIYSTGTHEDGTRGLWAIGDRGRGEPRLVVAFDHPELSLAWFTAGSDRVYLSVGTRESDVWVATVR